MKGKSDYYSLLGVARDATKEEIQKAYRKLARQYHPDVNKTAGAEDTFKRINEAHSVLTNDEKRALYDRYGENWQEAQHQSENAREWYGDGGGWQEQSSSFNFDGGENPFESDMYSDLFGNLFGNRGGGRHSEWGGFQDAPGRTIEAELSVSLDELVRGASKTVSWSTMEQHGSTIRPAQEKIQLKIPRGLKDGSVIRLAGKGEKASGRGPDGDMLLKINVQPDSRFALQGYNLVTTVPVAPWEAALGGKVEVETLDGRIHLNIPKGCRSGRRLRVKGKGLPYKGSGAGDIIVVVEIQVPQQLSKEEKELFEELKKKSSFNPRSGAGQRAAQMREAA